MRVQGAVLVMLTALVASGLGCAAAPRYTRTPSSGRDDLPGSLRRVQEGVASFYADEFHGRKTANGEVYDMYAMTAAHQALPFNTRVRVTNLDNGRAVVVRINDRGPFIKGRLIDLSYGAAAAIGMIGPGTARVRLEVLEIGS
jgi:rare lipoprotein A